MKTKNAFLMGAVALVAFVVSACSGGSSSNIAKDSPIGELPSYAAEYLTELNALHSEYWNSASNENREKAAKKYDKLVAKWKEAQNEIPSIEGNEIPLEVTEGLLFAPEGNLKITKIDAAETALSFSASATLKVTKDLKASGQRYVLVAFTKDGAPIARVGQVNFNGNDFDWNKGIYKEGVKAEASIVNGGNNKPGKLWEIPEMWGNLAKVVVMNATDPSFKEIEEKIRANVEKPAEK